LDILLNTVHIIIHSSANPLTKLTPATIISALYPTAAAIFTFAIIENDISLSYQLLPEHLELTLLLLIAL